MDNFRFIRQHSHDIPKDNLLYRLFSGLLQNAVGKETFELAEYLSCQNGTEYAELVDNTDISNYKVAYTNINLNQTFDLKDDNRYTLKNCVESYYDIKIHDPYHLLLSVSLEIDYQDHVLYTVFRDDNDCFDFSCLFKQIKSLPTFLSKFTLFSLKFHTVPHFEDIKSNTTILIKQKIMILPSNFVRHVSANKFIRLTIDGQHYVFSCGMFGPAPGVVNENLAKYIYSYNSTFKMHNEHKACMDELKGLMVE